MLQPRPQLIQYNGELVLDPAYMTSYQLDPKVFGPQASSASAAAQEEAAFAKALKNVASSRKQKSVDNNDLEGPVDESIDGDAQVLHDSREETTPLPSASSNIAVPLSAGPSNSAATNPSAKSPGDPLDGLMRVRICSVKNCHNPIPIDYFWKMCESCRILYRAWGVSKRARRRERRLEVKRKSYQSINKFIYILLFIQKLPPEERERREALRLKNKARLEAKNKQGENPVRMNFNAFIFLC